MCEEIKKAERKEQICHRVCVGAFFGTMVATYVWVVSRCTK